MHHDPRADLRSRLTQALTADGLVTQERALPVAQQTVEDHFTCVDIGGEHFELLNVTLRWQDLSTEAAREVTVLEGARWAGLLVLGALRWLDDMRYYHQFGVPYKYPDRDALDLGPVEAAACLAFARREHEAPRSTLEGLLVLANGCLSEVGIDPVDEGRLGEAVEKLRTLHCLVPRGGWYGLREEMKFQVPEE